MLRREENKEMCQTSARVVHTLTLEHERVAKMNVPLVEMAFVAIRLPRPRGFAAENTRQRDDERKAFHIVPPRTYLRPTSPGRHGILRNDSVVCFGADDGGTATAAAGVDGAEAAGRLNLMESDRNF